MTISFDSRAFEADLAALAQDMEREALQATKAIVKDAADATNEFGYKNRTGNLTRFRITPVFQSGGRIEGKIAWLAPYALWVDEDTVAHPIVAKPGKMLRFYINGNVVFRKRVWHPGTHGKHFSIRATDFFRNVGSERLQAGIDSAIQAHP
ncbi:MAG: hypothetical protein WC563_15700 [Brevundimonas sp.]